MGVSGCVQEVNGKANIKCENGCSLFCEQLNLESGECKLKLEGKKTIRLSELIDYLACMKLATPNERCKECTNEFVCHLLNPRDRVFEDCREVDARHTII